MNKDKYRKRTAESLERIADALDRISRGIEFLVAIGPGHGTLEERSPPDGCPQGLNPEGRPPTVGDVVDGPTYDPADDTFATGKECPNCRDGKPIEEIVSDRGPAFRCVGCRYVWPDDRPAPRGNP